MRILPRLIILIDPASCCSMAEMKVAYTNATEAAKLLSMQLDTKNYHEHLLIGSKNLAQLNAIYELNYGIPIIT